MGKSRRFAGRSASVPYRLSVRFGSRLAVRGTGARNRPFAGPALTLAARARPEGPMRQPTAPLIIPADWNEGVVFATVGRRANDRQYRLRSTAPEDAVSNQRPVEPPLPVSRGIGSNRSIFSPLLSLCAFVPLW